jgi:hypothetical protein
LVPLQVMIGRRVQVTLLVIRRVLAQSVAVALSVLGVAELLLVRLLMLMVLPVSRARRGKSHRTCRLPIGRAREAMEPVQDTAARRKLHHWPEGRRWRR